MHYCIDPCLIRHMRRTRHTAIFQASHTPQMSCNRSNAHHTPHRCPVIDQKHRAGCPAKCSCNGSKHCSSAKCCSSAALNCMCRPTLYLADGIPIIKPQEIIMTPLGPKRCWKSAFSNSHSTISSADMQIWPRAG